MLHNIIHLSLLATLVNALPDVSAKLQASQLRENYDFIVAGGGTTGLTIADRLTEAFPKKTVLVVEYGEIQYAPGIFDPPDTVWGGPGARADSWTFSSLPNPEVKNKTAFVFAGKTVGGSSSVNGMFFDRGSRFDYDAWARAGSPEFDESEHKWDWEGLFPYFKKSVTFTPPSAKMVQDYGYTWDSSAYGSSTPIYSSYPPFLWADNFIARDAWKGMGINVANECAGGDKEGLCWVPTSQHPVTALRSHAGLGHYDAVKDRTNFDLLVKHQVSRIIYRNGTLSGPPLVEVRSLEDAKLFNVTANAEVIMSAGALHTPTILQRSGIGPVTFLKDADIPLVMDLPGVGANFQDHSGPALSWNYSKPGNFSPLPSDMLNPVFAAGAAAEFNKTPARGPYTLAMGNIAIYVSLPNVTANFASIVNKIHSQVNDDTAASYLPATSDSTLIAGYKRQLSVLADFFANPKAPSIEVPFATGTAVRSFILHPLSRGTVRLNLTNPFSQPLLDYRSGTNPVDFDLHLAHLKFLRRMLDTDVMRKYGTLETSPGAKVQSDEALIEHIKDSMTLSFMHPCCTAAMLPRSLGGVVGPDLRVHGTTGLRVADMSILPFQISAHLSATAYAVGEKAADIIIQKWKE
ncbi:GMC oxidoreductase-like protein [Pyrenochaeta sp. MPI-SDFR-AT-0127]|nr:GMC oxidoreductase-like protein [Pyrenochaeta sp. MPI-SDFR-AT-0127]